MIPCVEEHGIVAKLEFQNAEEEASEIAKEVKRLVNEHGFTYSNFSILLRSVRTSSDPFIEALKSNKIPYIVGGKVGLFKRDEAVALGMLTTWLYKDGYWLTSTYGNDRISGNRLRDEGIQKWAASVRYSLNTGQIKTEMDAWKIKVLTTSPSDEYGYKDVPHDLLNILGFQKLDQNNDFDAVVMSMVGAFSKILGDFESSFRLGGQRREFYQELYDLCNFLNGFAIISYDEQPVEKASSANAVSIMTMHQSKGLEWPVVFMPAMINGRFPTMKKSEPEDIWMFDPALIANKSYFDSEEGEKRLFYVASTRAMKALIYSHFKNHKKQKANPSPFLDKVRGKYLEFENLPKVSLDRFTILKNSSSYILESYPVKELMDYEMCPYHYRLSKVWGYIQGVNTFMGYGDELHHILKVTSDLIKQKGLSTMQALKASSGEFFLPFASKGLKEKLKESVARELSEFVKDHEKDLKNIEETELRIEFSAKNATIIGKVDVIINSDSGLEVRDYKSSESVMKKEYSELQVRLYTRGLKDMGWNITKGSVANLKDNIVEPIIVSEQEISKSLVKAIKIIENIQNYQYPPRPGDFCELCGYRNICAHKYIKK
jgi:DNA helicase-2/ATP-dependent DNA helicase PcrA